MQYDGVPCFPSIRLASVVEEILGHKEVDAAVDLVGGGGASRKGLLFPIRECFFVLFVDVLELSREVVLDGQDVSRRQLAFFDGFSE